MRSLQNTDIFAFGRILSKANLKEEIFSFLASLFEMEVEDVKKLEPMETFEMISKVADWEKWKSFFSLGVKSMK